MQTITRIADLSMDELRRVRATLVTRFGVGRRGNVLEIGFGMATVGGSFDARRRDAICFYVRHKRLPRSTKDRIPAIVEVRLKRERRFVLVRMPSDVVSIGDRAIKPTGRRIRHASRPWAAAVAGAVVAWNSKPRQRRTWGLVTVGHLFRHRSRLPESEKNVRLQFAESPSRELSGLLLARSTRNDGSRVDAALVQVAHGILVRAGLVPPGAATNRKVVRAANELPSDAGVLGLSLPARRRVPLVVQRYLPTCNLVPELGALADAIDVVSHEARAFGEGRSGSLWVIKRQAAAVQFAGLPDDFRQGWGQSLETVLAWAREQLARLQDIRVADVDLRLVRAI